MDCEENGLRFEERVGFENLERNRERRGIVVCMSYLIVIRTCINRIGGAETTIFCAREKKTSFASSLKLFSRLAHRMLASLYKSILYCRRLIRSADTVSIGPASIEQNSKGEFAR